MGRESTIIKVDQDGNGKYRSSREEKADGAEEPERFSLFAYQILAKRHPTSNNCNRDFYDF